MDHCAQQQTEQYRAQIIELNQAVNSITGKKEFFTIYSLEEQLYVVNIYI